MSYGVFLLRHLDGEVTPPDAERLREVTAPYVVAGGPEDGFSQLRAEDGGEANLHHEDGVPCVTATRFARGAVTGLLVRLAADLGAVFDGR